MLLSVFAVAALLGLVLGLVLQPQDATSGPTVELSYATYVGDRRESGINAFRGMRYASPPLGDLRWRAPIEPQREERAPTRAKAYGPVCLGTDAGYPNDSQDEDCLFVNVWAPADLPAGTKLPVWLFIQGGGYTANTNANYDGEAVVRRSNNSIVFVNFNYRVGLFGFLASDKVRGKGSLNAGLLDQRFAMQWVQKYISQFGGDPGHVVISGVSAGAGSVALQLTAYGGRDDRFFVGAIVQSLFFPAQPYLSELEWQFDRLVAGVGCNKTDEDPMDCLRSLSTRKLQLTGNRASPFPGRTQPPLPLFYWTPCVDGDLIMDLPYDMFERGNYINVPLIMGTDTNEGSYFATNTSTQEEMRTFLNNNFPKLRDTDLDAIEAQYPLLDRLPGHNRWFPSTSKAYGEGVFICPTENVLDDVVRKTTTTPPAEPPADKGPWSYRYNVEDGDFVRQGLGVPHTFELPAVFGPGSVYNPAQSYFTYNAAIVPVVMDYWVSFVKTLSPNTFRSPGAPVWQSWAATLPPRDNGTGNGTAAASPARSRLLFETNKTRMESTPTDEALRCELWRSLKDYTQQKRRKRWSR